MSGSTGDSLLFATYLGGQKDDYDPLGERGIKFNNCRIYLAVTSESNDFPLTTGTIDSVYSPSDGSTYLPLIVSMANPPDLTGNTITGGNNQQLNCGSTPATITCSTPTYVIPAIIRNGTRESNGTTSAYPDGLPAITSFQWQVSLDGGNTWSDHRWRCL